MPYEKFAAFMIAITLLTMAPGADTLMVTRNSIRGGFRDGFFTSLGICMGLFIHATVSACGLALIILSSAKLYHFIKLLGAGYIIWMGGQNLLRAIRGGSIAENATTSTGMFNVRKSLREGLLSNVLNPKTAIFYMAFLPQFMDPQKSLLVQSFLLAGIHFILAMIWQCAIAAMVDRAKILLTSRRISRCFDTAVGSLLIALGLKLAASDT